MYEISCLICFLVSFTSFFSSSFLFYVLIANLFTYGLYSCKILNNENIHDLIFVGINVNLVTFISDELPNLLA
jgi:hypothetical protein